MLAVSGCELVASALMILADASLDDHSGGRGKARADEGSGNPLAAPRRPAWSEVRSCLDGGSGQRAAVRATATPTRSEAWREVEGGEGRAGPLPTRK